MLKFQFERWAEFAPEAGEIFPLHWQELGLDRDLIHLRPDHERYLKMDEMGMLHITTARHDGRLVGYAVNFLLEHMHYKGAGVMAVADMYFLLPEFRCGANGVRLFAEMERGLIDRGAVRAHTSCKVHQDHEQLFTKLGWKLTDKTFSKLLKANPCR